MLIFIGLHFEFYNIVEWEFWNSFFCSWRISRISPILNAQKFCFENDISLYALCVRDRSGILLWRGSP